MNHLLDALGFDLCVVPRSQALALVRDAEELRARCNKYDEWMKKMAPQPCDHCDDEPLIETIH